jgi:type IV pilus assembly protein PilC
MKFFYQARTKEGDIKSGIIEASSRETALSLLQKLGYYVTYLREQEQKPIYAKEITLFQRVSLKDLYVFSYQLSILLNSKVPIVESLLTLAFQTKNRILKEIIVDISKEVEAGTSLSKALLKYPEVFSQFYIAMVKAGESAGKLPLIFNSLANHLEREYNLKGKITTMMIYPSLILFVFLAVSGLLIFTILPSFEQIFIENNAQIPFITKTLLSFGKFTRENFLLLLSVLGTITFFIYSFSRTKEGKKIFDKIFLKLPILGQILKQINLSMFSQNLSTLISAGLTITEALEIVGEIVGNDVYKEAISEIKEGVKKGEKISSISSLYPYLFTPLFNQIVLIGEKTGTLSNSLSLVSDFYQKEVERAIENFLKILEPLLIIIMGGLVGGLMLSLFLPLYNLLGTY